MRVVFADTFYWAALTNIDDPAYGQAMELSRSHQSDRIVTTDEVLREYLTFFAGARPRVRERAGMIVAELLDEESSGVRVIPQSRHFEQEGFRALFHQPR